MVRLFSRPFLLLAGVLAGALAVAAAQSQSDLGLSLGFNAQVDAPVHDVPSELEGFDPVVVRTAGGLDVAQLSLRRDDSGTVRLSGGLPDLRSSGLLEPIDSEELWPCPLSFTTEAAFQPVNLWLDAVPAVIEMATGPLPPAPEPHYRQFVLVFADAVVGVQGSCLELPQPVTVDLVLRPGWNLVASETALVDGLQRIRLSSADEADLAEAGWYWRGVPEGQVPSAHDVEPAPERP